MKRLLALLMTFIISLSNNVEFTSQDNKEYDSSNIYRLECDMRQPDYREQKQIHNTISSAVSCRNKNFKGSGKRVDYGSDSPGIRAYWFTETSKKISDITASEKSISLSENGSAIIAPYDCYLSTENLDANDCTTMELVCTIHNDEMYRISISGMSMWYCDKNRDELLPHTWENPDSNGKRHTFSAGDVLGYTSPNTVITVNAMENGAVTNRAITLRSFFMQE